MFILTAVTVTYTSIYYYVYSLLYGLYPHYHGCVMSSSCPKQWY